MNKPAQFLVAYWTGTTYVIAIAGKDKPFITTDAKSATAAIECMLEQIKDEETPELQREQ